MNGLKRLLRRWLEVDSGAPSPSPLDSVDRELLERTSGNVDRLNRQVAALRGLIQQQADFTMEALHRAGWQSDHESAQQKQLHRAFNAIQGDGDVIVGPWTGEVGFELLYWIPFLNWLATQGLDGRRVVVVSRGGAAPWYRHLTSRYVDLLDLMTPDEFRERTTASHRSKQFNPHRQLDQDILATVRARYGLDAATVVHPSAMYRLFTALWRKRATIELLEAFTSFQPLGSPAPPDAALGLPPDYVVAKFYFSTAFPATDENRRFVKELLERVSRQAPIVLLSTSVRMDDHDDFQTDGGSGVYVVDAHQTPQNNLGLQTQIIRGARGFIGTYGGFSYLAPFYGIRSVSFFSRRGFEAHHLDLANRMFDRLLRGGFAALDRRAIDLVEPAIARWTTTTSLTPDAASERA